MRRLAGLVAAVAALGVVAGCGDDDEGDGAATATVTVTQTAPAQPTVTAPPATTTTASNRCPDVAITPQSGEGAFNVTVENISCEEAEELLRSSAGLRSWRCRVIAEGQGTRTTSCSDGNRVIVFATEA